MMKHRLLDGAPAVLEPEFQRLSIEAIENNSSPRKNQRWTREELIELRNLGHVLPVGRNRLLQYALKHGRTYCTCRRRLSILLGRTNCKYSRRI